MSDPSAALVARTLAGESAAFDDLVALHRSRIVRFIDLLIWDSDEAENLGQEALTRAYEQLVDYRSEFPFGAWLRGIALNLARNHLRNSARRARTAVDDQLESAPAPSGRRQGVLSGIIHQEIAGQIDQAIHLLPEGLREAFILHASEGLSFEEIGQILGVSAGTGRVRAHRARMLLRNRLGPVVDTWYREQPAGQS